MSRASLRCWLPALLWVAVIYTAIPFVRHLREFFVARWPAQLIGYGVMAVVVVGTVAALFALYRRRTRLRPADVAWLLAVATALVVWIHHLMGQPEATVHFVEYGLLGVLLHRALRASIPDATIYASAVVAGALIGTFDEVIQWIVPGRFFDFRDIVLNTGAVALAQVVMWRLAPRAAAPVGTRPLRLACRLAAAEVLLLTLCFAATPQRIARLTSHLPVLGNAALGNNAICEYGHRLAVDALTEFSSRLTTEELVTADAERAAEVAAMIDASRGAYGQFLETVSPADDPFAYEARVHLFARDRSFGEAGRLEKGSNAYREHMTTAFRENLILERFFAATLATSSFTWPPKLHAEAAAGQDPGARFVSSVGAHLITAVSERALRVMMLALFAALVVCSLCLGRRPFSSPLSASPRE
ncbi:MAG: VanZ family protein [Acidobacteriota bacterium]